MLLSYAIGELALISPLIVASDCPLIVNVLPVTEVVKFVPPAIVNVSEFVLLANDPESAVNVFTMF